MDHNFQVDLRGMVDLLSNHLYSSPDVYVRELLQNAVDAIRARQIDDPSFAGGAVEIELGRSGGRPTLVVHDDGIGLAAPDVHRFLATIGKSSKRDALEHARDDFIGQFGIGLLSCFLVTDEILVITRSAADPHARPVEWRGRPDGTYSVRELDDDLAPGTRVYLRAAPGSEEWFAPEAVAGLVARYGDLLPCRVTVSGENGQLLHAHGPEPLPWEALAGREELLAYGARLLGHELLDAVPLTLPSAGVSGVAFVLPFPVNPGARRHHRVYLKRMLLSERAEGLFPEWALFVSAILDVEKLRPTASRESFVDDADLATTREELGRALRAHLVDLARTQPDRLEAIVGVHALSIKALAAHDDEALRVFADWLPYETSLGHMTLGEYRRREEVVRYAGSVDEFRQISGVAAAQGVAVLNGGYVYDRDVLERLPVVMPGLRVEMLEPDELVGDLADLSLDEREEFHRFLLVADLALQPLRCGAIAKRFEPESLPCLYTIGERAAFMRSVERTREIAGDLFGDALSGFHEESGGSFSRLCFNAANPLVRRIATLRDRELQARLVEMLYVQSLLLGHHPLSRREVEMLGDSVLALIEQRAGEEAA